MNTVTGPRSSDGHPSNDPALSILLHEMLRERSIPCPLCAYDLRNLPGTRCPECGAELTLQVGLTEPRLGPCLTLLTGCCIGLGGSALFNVLAMVRAPLHWWHEMPASILLLQLVLTSALLPAILTRRKRFRRASAGNQRMMARVVCTMVAVLWMAFISAFEN
jgi:hypothetical protein